MNATHEALLGSSFEFLDTTRAESPLQKCRHEPTTKEIRTYISEPDRGRRNWTGKTEEEQAAKSAARDAVYDNRRRVKGDRGKRLMKARGELIECSFAHCYDTGRCAGRICAVTRIF